MDEFDADNSLPGAPNQGIHELNEHQNSKLAQHDRFAEAVEIPTLRQRPTKSDSWVRRNS